MLIAGRVITGCGGAGITIGTYVIISHLVPPSKVSAFIGGIGAAFSIASVAGPLVGGAFTGQVSWRFWYVLLLLGCLMVLIICVISCHILIAVLVLSIASTSTLSSAALQH